jgi:hypothetical protein
MGLKRQNACLASVRSRVQIPGREEGEREEGRKEGRKGVPFFWFQH